MYEHSFWNCVCAGAESVHVWTRVSEWCLNGTLLNIGIWISNTKTIKNELVDRVNINFAGGCCFLGSLIYDISI